MDKVETIEIKLENLQAEHRDLDDIISEMRQESVINPIQLQRLKKRRQAIEDQIAQLKSELLPDIIA